MPNVLKLKEFIKFHQISHCIKFLFSMNIYQIIKFHKNIFKTKNNPISYKEKECKYVIKAYVNPAAIN